jgi:hypothetical protein
MHMGPHRRSADASPAQRSAQIARVNLGLWIINAHHLSPPRAISPRPQGLALKSKPSTQEVMHMTSSALFGTCPRLIYASASTHLCKRLCPRLIYASASIRYFQVPLSATCPQLSRVGGLAVGSRGVWGRGLTVGVTVVDRDMDESSPGIGRVLYPNCRVVSQSSGSCASLFSACGFAFEGL